VSTVNSVKRYLGYVSCAYSQRGPTQEQYKKRKVLQQLVWEKKKIRKRWWLRVVENRSVTRSLRIQKSVDSLRMIGSFWRSAVVGSTWDGHKSQASWQQKTAAAFNSWDPYRGHCKLCEETKDSQHRQMNHSSATRHTSSSHPIQSLLSRKKIMTGCFFGFVSFFFSKEKGWIQF
jgi:hypothetical protein